MSVYQKDNPVWLRESFDSIFAQTLLPNEVVLVEDGPLNDSLEDVINNQLKNHPEIKIVKNKTNLGLGLALKNAVDAASYDIVARMDSDDTMPAERFEKQMAVIETGYDVVSCWSQLFEGEQSNVIAVKTRPKDHDDIVRLAHKRSPVCHAACMMRKDAIIKAGNYQHCKLYEDYHLWIRMIMSGARFYNVQEVLYYVRTTSDQVKRRSGLKYLKTELGFFKEFHKRGFFTTSDYIKNSTIRVLARLAPASLRSSILKRIWNHKQ